MKRLTELNEGESAKVALLTHTGSIKRRFRDLGLTEGTRVSCIQKSPFGGMTAYGIRGAVIALRADDACFVVVG